jgi:hypothetical protein
VAVAEVVLLVFGMLLVVLNAAKLIVLTGEPQPLLIVQVNVVVAVVEATVSLKITMELVLAVKFLVEGVVYVPK